ncbi:hypothetical protein EE612_000210 [Oryza sativa]|nr:hypothetical protein EE612_000210 [Oryza sativa]
MYTSHRYTKEKQLLHKLYIYECVDRSSFEMLIRRHTQLQRIFFSSRFEKNVLDLSFRTRRKIFQQVAIGVHHFLCAEPILLLPWE